jgi:hypothetical protein
MDRGTAKAICSLAQQIDLKLGEIIWHLETRPDVGPRDELVRGAYNLVLDMHENLVLPIARQYPDLHPDDPKRFRQALERMKDQT